jgi:hypothetical protein
LWPSDISFRDGAYRLACLHGLDEVHGGVHAQGYASARVGGDGEGEVGHGEEGSAMQDVGPVQMLVLDQHLDLGEPRFRLDYLDPRLRGEAIPFEELRAFRGEIVHVPAQSSFLRRATSCANLSWTRFL